MDEEIVREEYERLIREIEEGNLKCIFIFVFKKLGWKKSGLLFFVRTFLQRKSPETGCRNQGDFFLRFCVEFSRIRRGIQQHSRKDVAEVDVC